MIDRNTIVDMRRISEFVCSIFGEETQVGQIINSFSRSDATTDSLSSSAMYEVIELFDTIQAYTTGGASANFGNTVKLSTIGDVFTILSGSEVTVSID